MLAPNDRHPAFARGGISRAAIALACLFAAWDLVRPGPWPGILLLLLGTATIVVVLRSASRLPADAPPDAFAIFAEGLRLGLTGFGGGLAVLALIETRIVRVRRWLDPLRFLEYAALAQSLPGAISANALAFAGRELAGPLGSAAAVGGFILPSALMLLGFALAYGPVRQLSLVDAAFAGLLPAVAALVMATALRLARRLVPSGRAHLRALWTRKWDLAVAAASAVAVEVFKLGAVEVLLAAGAIGLLRASRFGPDALERELALRWRWMRQRAVSAILLARTPRRLWKRREGSDDDLPAIAGPLGGFGAVASALGGRLELLGTLGTVFLRAGALTFGGGYVIVPLLEAELVTARHWLSPQAFADAMALGQITPGPVVITATFVGYALSGATGAIIATLAVFLPSFVLVQIVGASIDRFRASALTQAFLSGLRPAVVGLLAAASVAIARSGVHGTSGYVIGVVTLGVFLFARLSPGLVLGVSAALGVLLRIVRLG